MEAVERYKETTQKTHHDAQIDTILEVCVQVLHFKVQLVQMFVDKRDQWLHKKYIYNKYKNTLWICTNLFHNAQLGWIAVKQRIECITLTSHANVIILWSQLLLVFSVEKKHTFINNKIIIL